MAAKFDVMAVIEHFVHNGTTSRDRINAERARAAVADLIEECDALAMTPRGHVDSVLQARIAAVSAALARVKGE